MAINAGHTLLAALHQIVDLVDARNLGTNRRHYMGQKSKEQALPCQLKLPGFAPGSSMQGGCDQSAAGFHLEVIIQHRFIT